MYKHVKTGCKHIPPSEQPLQFQSGYFLNKPHMYVVLTLDPQVQLYIVNIVLTLQSQVQYHNVNAPLEKCIREVQ